VVTDNADMESRSKMSDVNGISSDGNIETMLSVEKGLRELASLKVFLKLEVCMDLYATSKFQLHVSMINLTQRHDSHCLKSSLRVLIDVHDFLECETYCLPRHIQFYSS
jgi:hypothetical protein